MTKENLDALKKYTLEGIKGMNGSKEIEPKIRKARDFKQFKKIINDYWGWTTPQTVFLLEGFLKKITKQK